MSGASASPLADTIRLIGDVPGRAVQDAPASWNAVFARIAAATHSSLAAMFLRDTRQSIVDLEVVGMHGYPASSIESYRAYYGGLDREAIRVSHLPVGRHLVVRPGEVLTDPISAEIHNDYFRPIGGGQGIGFKLFDDSSRFCMLSVHRPIDARPIDTADIATLRIVTAHLRRALQVQRQLAEVRHVNASLLAALDYLPTAVFVIDRQARPLSMNRAADALLLRPGAPLRLDSGRLATALGTDAAAFAAAIAGLATGLASGPDTRPQGPPPLLRITGRDRKRYGVMLAPLPDSTTSRPVEPVGLLFVSDVERERDPDVALLRAEFGLTHAEAEVAACLARGWSADAVATHRGASLATVRVQIKSVLAKTGTRSQVQLVARLHRGVAFLGGGGSPTRMPAR